MRLFLVVCVLLCGCSRSRSQDEVQAHQLLNKPIKIAEQDGVTVWKVKDETPGGKMQLYFTTPSGQLLE